MAAAIKQRTADITECSICMEPFKNPRCLPCIHSFCLDCLKQFGKNEKPGSKMSCPMCRQVFTIPAVGFDGLTRNYFLEHIMAIKTSEINSKSSQKQICELCNDDEGDSASASVYCVECRFHLCGKCSGGHRKLPFAKLHTILPLEEMKISQNLSRKLYVTFCDKHGDEQLKLFCYDCKIAVCLMCFAVNHTGHKCSDINESAKSFKVQFQDSKHKQMIKCISDTENELTKLDLETQQTLQQIDSVQRQIQSKSDELKAKIDNEQRQLGEQLNKLKEKRIESIETRRANLTLQLATIRSFAQYIQELLEKGSLCDISRSATDLLRRRDELITSQTTNNRAKLQLLNVAYGQKKQSVSALDSTNLLGWLTLNGQPGSDFILQQYLKLGSLENDSIRICPYGCQQGGQQLPQQQEQHNYTQIRNGRQNNNFFEKIQEDQRKQPSQPCIHGFQPNVRVASNFNKGSYNYRCSPPSQNSEMWN